jgi:bifunctional non-homologous end joining protein LigD
MPSACWSVMAKTSGRLSLSMLKVNLARLLARPADGIFIADYWAGEIGLDLFRAACGPGLEGLVSKHRDRGYRAGRSPNWIKVKNPTSPAMTRAKGIDWSERFQEPSRP